LSRRMALTTQNQPSGGLKNQLLWIWWRMFEGVERPC
jgi:hypothetical protein